MVEGHECFVCNKLRTGSSVDGGVLYEDDIVYAGDVTGGSNQTYLGHLAAEPKRHVEGIDELSTEEAEALGRLVRQLAVVLRARMVEIARGAPWLARVILGFTVPAVRWFPDRVIARTSAPTPASDKAVLERPDVQKTLIASLREAIRNGGRGAAYELTLYTRPWGFPLREAPCRIDLWQGTDDVNVPASMGEHLASQLPDCHPHFLPGEGHFSLLANHQQEILATLTG